MNYWQGDRGKAKARPTGLMALCLPKGDRSASELIIELKVDTNDELICPDYFRS